MAEAPRREIIREHEFEEQLARLIPDLEQADEFVAGAEELLSWAPTMGSLNRKSLAFGLFTWLQFEIGK